jgi:hypothetical protein
VALRQHEQVRVGPRVDVADGDKPVSLRDVVALVSKTAEKAIVRQREAPSLGLRGRSNLLRRSVNSESCHDVLSLFVFLVASRRPSDSRIGATS